MDNNNNYIGIEKHQFKTINKLFEEQVVRTPNKVAVVCRDESLTYLELNKKSNQLARKLIKSGVKSNEIIALMIKRSVNMMVAIMGILKAGGCYLPVDNTYPTSRINYMLQDSNAKIMLTEGDIEEGAIFSGERVFLDDTQIYGDDDGNLTYENSPEDLAYVIYTSGSTGKPKGVMIEHRSIHNFINGMIEKIPFTPDKSIVSLTSISFDIFALESLLPLSIGMKVIVADPMQLSKYLGSGTVDMLQTTPSTVRLLLNEKKNLKYFKNLTEIMVGGEAFPTRLLKELQQCTDARIYNMYGPTETTVWSTVQDLTTSDVVTIGKPIVNTQIYIVNEDHKPVADGETGELCIAGDGLARGYLGKEALTKEKFMIAPSISDKPMYKTGDMARILPSGDLEYLGRNDTLVKIRGFRIGLGEIEDCLRMNEKIIDCAVIAAENELKENYLVVYYVTEDDISISDIIAFLGKEMPEYMIPGVYVKMNKIPLNSNGKIDRNQLPKPNMKRPDLATFYESPQNEIETEISKIWKRILNIDLVGVKDNFFQLGGNSVLLSQMFVEVNEKFPDKLEIVDIFANPTVSQLSELISDKGLGEISKEVIAGIQLKEEFYSHASRNDGRVVLKTELDQEIVKRLQKYTDTKAFNISHLLLGGYLFILSQIALSDEIEMIAAFEKNNSKITIDFKEIDDLENLIMDVYHQSLEEKGFKGMIANQLTRLRKDDKTIYPFFYFNASNSVVSEKKETFQWDLVVRTNPQRRKAEFTMSFNEGKLNKANVERMFIRYLSLLKNIASKI